MIAVDVLDTGDGMNEPGTPVDVVGMRADDALVDALGGDRKTRPADSDLELARRLIAARREVEAEPFGDLVSVDEAMAILGHHRRSRRWSSCQALFVAVCVLVIVACVAGLWSSHADPGELLWPLHQLLYGGAW